MNYDQFADSFFAEVANVQNNTLLIDSIRAQSMIRADRQHAISFFNNHLEALKVLSAERSDTVKSRKLLVLYDQLLFQIALYFENDEQDTSFRERLTTTMNQLAQDNLQ